MSFETDPFPKNPKILFIGWPNSTHTHAWIELLRESMFNVRLYGLPTHPPNEWPVRTYLSIPLKGRDKTIRKQMQSSLVHKWNQIAGLISCIRPIGSDELRLAKVIRNWRPDVIHTLGFDPASYFYLRCRRQYGLEKIGHWIAQARGGPDLYLYRHDPLYHDQILQVFHECESFIADNQWNYDFAISNGLSAKKLTPLGIVSGTGGMDVSGLRSKWEKPPSHRERIIYIPKMYDNQAVKGLSLIEGLKLAWPDIFPCRVIMSWVVQNEMQMWLKECLGSDILRHCEIHNLVPRVQSLDYTLSARVVYAPSVLDGIPNCMLEAMCCGAFPVISPLESVTGVVKNETNVLFARNLYPHELAEALTRAMNDDDLVDAAAQLNFEMVQWLSNREHVRKIALDFYAKAAESARKGNKNVKFD